MGALSAPTEIPPQTRALVLLIEASALRDDGSRIPLRWCRRLHALRIEEGFSSGMQAMIPDWISPRQRQSLMRALLAADTDTAASGRLGAALLQQDGRHALLHDPDSATPSVSIPGYVRAALASLPCADATGLSDPRISAHERLALAARLHLAGLHPAPQAGPAAQRLLYLRTHEHILLLEHRPDSALPRILGLHR